jgi:hypothetical protein
MGQLFLMLVNDQTNITYFSLDDILYEFFMVLRAGVLFRHGWMAYWFFMFLKAGVLCRRGWLAKKYHTGSSWF